MNFLIWAWDYSTDTGGGVALHRLAHELALRGHDARLTCRETAPGWQGKPIPWVTLAARDQVVIYPEIVNGNPLRGARVVRWILNTPGFFGPQHGDGVYGDRDLIMQWYQGYKVDPKYTVAGLLRVYRDYSAFVDKGHLRIGSCYAVRKGRHKVLDKHDPESLRLEGIVGDDELLIAMFNTCVRFISYDDNTMLTALAAMCGCQVTVITADERVVEMDSAELIRNHEQQIAESAGQVERFIELCEEHWA